MQTSPCTGASVCASPVPRPRCEAGVPICHCCGASTRCATASSECFEAASRSGPEPVPLSHYETVYANEPGSAETPSAGRSLSWELLLDLRRQGVDLSDILLHTGLSSLQDDAVDAEHPLFEEWFAVSPNAAEAVNRAPRVIAVGTTVVRALETAAGHDGQARAIEGWTRLRLGPGSPLRVVNGLLTGFHEPQASHFDLLRAFLDEPLLDRAYREAIAERYLWHEFGDLCLIL